MSFSPADTPSPAAPTSSKRPSLFSPPSTPNKKARKITTDSPKIPSTSSPGVGGIDWAQVEGWTPEKRMAFMERIIKAGVASIGSAALQSEFGMTKIGINNAISAGKKNNMRTKAIEAVK